MEKLQFYFKVLAARDDPKTNLLCITYIATPDGRKYKIPDDYIHVQCHTALMKTPAYNKVKKTLTTRGQTRKVWINLTTDLSETYIDEAGNLQFEDMYLEEEINTNESGIAEVPEQPLIKLLEKLLEKNQEQSDNINLGKIAKEFTIEKFNSLNYNADQWMTNFENECERFKIIKNEKKIEILKSFMEKGAIDWYSCTLLKLTIQANWTEWKKSFCDTFANKGWSSIRYALNFKYQAGSLLEYAIKKEKLLLNVRISIDNGTLMDLIATGLPNFVADRIDREKLNKTEDLYNEIGKLEHMVNKKNLEKNKNKFYDNKDKLPCETCKKLNKGTRFHPSTECWFKEKNSKIKHVNNSILETELSATDPKN